MFGIERGCYSKMPNAYGEGQPGGIGLLAASAKPFLECDCLASLPTHQSNTAPIPSYRLQKKLTPAFVLFSVFFSCQLSPSLIFTITIVSLLASLLTTSHPRAWPASSMSSRLTSRAAPSLRSANLVFSPPGGGDGGARAARGGRAVPGDRGPVRRFVPAGKGHVRRYGHGLDTPRWTQVRGAFILLRPITLSGDLFGSCGVESILTFCILSERSRCAESFAKFAPSDALLVNTWRSVVLHSALPPGRISDAWLLPLAKQTPPSLIVKSGQGCKRRPFSFQ